MRKENKKVVDSMCGDANIVVIEGDLNQIIGGIRIVWLLRIGNDFGSEFWFTSVHEWQPKPTCKSAEYFMQGSKFYKHLKFDSHY